MLVLIFIACLCLALGLVILDMAFDGSEKVSAVLLCCALFGILLLFLAEEVTASC